MTIQQALHTVNGMSARRSQQRPSLPDARRGRLAGSPVPPEATLFDEEIADTEDAIDDVIVPPTPPTPKNPSRKVRLPKGDPALDFNSPTPTFREYVAEKKPQAQFDWFLLVAKWLMDHKNVEEIGLVHIVTANQYMGGDWAGGLPADAGKPFRDGCRPTSGIFTGGSKRGLYKITKNGENRIARLGTAT